jgi:O-antigen/teichoic acid export membrane protein
MSLVVKSVSGTIWTLLDIIFNKAIYFIATLVLARLLGPNEFGLIGMIMVFFTIGTTLVDSGLSVSLIRTPNLDDAEYSTVFFMNLAMSLIAYLFVFVLAPFVADFYAQPILEPLIRIYCLGFIITALRMIAQAKLVREMNFKKIAILNVPGNIVGLFVGVWMALDGYRVWSIVGLYLSTQIVATMMYWIFIKWRPKFIFRVEKMKYHFSFGYKLMISAQLNTIFDNIYNIIIGKLYSVQSLGYYERAYTLNNYPVSILSGIISKVSLPLLSQISDDKQRTLNVYRKIMMLSFFISAPLMLGALVLAKPLFILFLGEQWIAAVPFFQILCLAYMLYPIHSLNINILSVYGKSNLFLKLEIIKKIMVVALVLITVNFGIYGLVWSSVIASVLALFINTYYSGGLILYYTKDQLKDILPTLIISIVMAIAMYFASLLLADYFRIIQIVVPALLGLSIFASLSYITKNESFFNIIFLIKNKKLNDTSY